MSNTIIMWTVCYWDSDCRSWTMFSEWL